MKIHSLSRVLVLPLLAIVGVVYLLATKVDVNYSILIFLPVTLGVVLYIFHGVIDYWYLNKYPYGLDPHLKKWLKQYFKPYLLMKDIDRQKFDHRLELYLYGRLFNAVGTEWKEVPEDIKCMIACQGIWMTLGLEDFLIGDVDRIFLYKHNFPTPENQQLHAVEVNQVDGVIILNSALAAQALLEPTMYYNVVIHAYAEAIMALQLPTPKCEDETKLEMVSGWKKQDILKQTGLKEIENTLLHVHHFFVFPESYRRLYPDYYTVWSEYFRMRE
ncbi:MAG: hypothetical protein WAT79_17370 [Saprospiraceae bacterium]